MNFEKIVPFLEPAIEQSRMSFWKWDVTNDILEFSELWGFLGYTGRELSICISEWESLVYPADLKYIQKAMNDCIYGANDNYTTSIRMVRQDGSIIWMQDRGIVTKRDGSGKAVEMVGIQQDVDRFIEAEVKLRDQKKHMDIISEISGQSYWEWYCDDNRLVFSDHFYRIYGYLRDHISETLDGWYDLVHPDDRQMVDDALQAYRHGDSGVYRVDLRMRHSQGEYLWVTTSGQIVEKKDGKAHKLIGGLINIDERKKTEHALQDALSKNEQYNRELQADKESTEQELRTDLLRQDRLQKLVNSIALVHLAAQPEHIDTLVENSLKELGRNIHADRVYIMRHTETDGVTGLRPIYEWVETEKARAKWGPQAIFNYSDYGDWHQRLAKGESICKFTEALEPAQKEFFSNLGVQSLLLVPIHLGDEFWGVLYFADSYKTRLSDEAEIRTLQSGGMLIVLSILRNDATLRMTEAMEKAQASARSKTLFLAAMSHEMKTPLNAILGMTKIATENPDRLLACRDEIERAAKRLLAVINDVLEIADMDASGGKLNNDDFLVSDLLTEVYEEHAHKAAKKNIDFTQKCRLNGYLVVFADKTKIMRILGVLIDNAIKFTPSGGKVELTAREINREAKLVSIEFAVKDNGIGIHPDKLDKIFEPFEQSDTSLARTYEGTGLGLPIAAALAEKLDSIILVKSKSGVGSTFYMDVDLDICNGNYRMAANGEAVLEITDDDIKLTGKRVLIVEDNDINALITQSILEDAGALTEHVGNGQIAVEQIASGETLFDIVLMDIQMPVMDGYEATKAIRALEDKKRSRIPIIALTANSLAESIDTGQRAGMDGYMAKPIEADALLAVVYEHTYQRGHN